MRFCRATIALILLACGTHTLAAQEAKSGCTNRHYAVNIEIGKAYISGICVAQRNEGEEILSIVNEFGVSALTCKRNGEGKPLRIVNILKPLNKFYIKRVLRKDLYTILPELLGEASDKEREIKHNNERYGISYRFRPISDI